jgi:hypothetical protein
VPEVIKVHFLTAEDVHPPHHQHPEHTGAEVPVFRYWRHNIGVPGPMRMQMKGPWPTEVDASVRACARIDHGRWIADCAFGCGSAEYVSKVDRRSFCIECGNGGTGKWVAVTWPADDDIAAAESFLGLRAEPDLRNWDPREETIDELRSENAEHGVTLWSHQAAKP